MFHLDGRSVEAIWAGTVPSLPKTVDNIPIGDVVKRVKCEILQAASKDWTNWGATVDLTLIVNTQAGITPGVSVINLLAQVVDKARGTFSQSFFSWCWWHLEWASQPHRHDYV